MPVVINGTSGITGNTGTLISASTVGVGGATPSASGAGVTFPATQSASTNANTLDDYEEGTFTPLMLIGGQTTGITYNVQEGYYTKVGRMVQFSIRVSLSSKGALSGTVSIEGLPFTISSIAQPCSVYFQGGAFTIGSGNFPQMYPIPTTTRIDLNYIPQNSSQDANYTNSSVGTGNSTSNIFLNGTYFA